MNCINEAPPGREEKQENVASVEWRRGNLLIKRAHISQSVEKERTEQKRSCVVSDFGIFVSSV